MIFDGYLFDLCKFYHSLILHVEQREELVLLFHKVTCAGLQHSLCHQERHQDCPSKLKIFADAEVVMCTDHVFLHRVTKPTLPQAGMSAVGSWELYVSSEVCTASLLEP